MKINIFRQEEGEKFYITFADRNTEGREFGSAITLDMEDAVKLNEMLTSELKSLDKSEMEKTEVVWNPRSHRHEIVKK